MVRKWQVKTFNRMIGLQYPGLALCVDRVYRDGPRALRDVRADHRKASGGDSDEV